MIRQFRTAVVSVLVFTVLCGFVFPAVVTGIGQTLFPRQANGSLITRDGRVIGSTLIGQSFSGPGYFHGRPSAAGSGYDAGASGGTNLGPTSEKLIDGIADLAAAYRRVNGLAAGTPIPPDAATRSASGLDPHITPANAALQAARVARERGVPVDRVLQALDRHTEGRQLGLLGEPRVDVLALNLELDRILGPGASPR